MIRFIRMGSLSSTDDVDVVILYFLLVRPKREEMLILWPDSMIVMQNILKNLFKHTGEFEDLKNKYK